MKSSAFSLIAAISMTTLSSLGVSLATIGTIGCTESPNSDNSPSAHHHSETTFAFAGPNGNKAVVHRMKLEDGSESFHGETHIVMEPSANVLRVLETATLDRQGKLLSARISVDGNALESSIHMQIVPSNGNVEITQGNHRSEFPVPTDAPWTYTPWAAKFAVATPVSAWIANRAAQSAPQVRLISPRDEKGWLIPRDQVAVATETGTTVVLGWDAADIRTEFVHELRIGGQSALVRMASPQFVL